MKTIAQSWDFLFGVILIGGVPWSIVALTMVLGDAFQRLFHATIPDDVGLFVVAVSGLAAVIGCGGALMFRLHHRKLPIGFVFLEASLGLVGAVALLLCYGVLMHSVID